MIKALLANLIASRCYTPPLIILLIHSICELCYYTIIESAPDPYHTINGRVKGLEVSKYLVAAHIPRN